MRALIKALAFRIPAFQRWWLKNGPIVRHRLAGSPVPPHEEVKHFWLERFRNKYDCKILIETGTNFGHTVEAMLCTFDVIHTIELDEGLWRKASEKFASSPHVHVICGDSGLILSPLLAGINERCLFWLDGHFCGPGTAGSDGDTPIVREISAINAHGRNDHVILIDDARLFNGENGYPTVGQIIELCKKINQNYRINIVDDIIRIFEK